MSFEIKSILVSLHLSSTRLYLTIWHIIHEDTLYSCSSLMWLDHVRLLTQVSIRGKFMNEIFCIDLTHKYKCNKHTCSSKYSLPVFGLSVIGFKTTPHRGKPHTWDIMTLSLHFPAAVFSL